MSDANTKPQDREPTDRPTTQSARPTDKPAWETPKIEDVSEQVMAQPYIRFT